MIQNAVRRLKTIFAPRISAANVSPRLLELATSGNLDAQAMLGEIYFNDGREENYAASYHWNGQAARQGHAASQARLATIYHKGLGIDVDPQEACRWLRSAARKGDDGARQIAGLRIPDGLDVEPNTAPAGFRTTDDLKGRNHRPLEAKPAEAVSNQTREVDEDRLGDTERN